MSTMSTSRTLGTSKPSKSSPRTTTTTTTTTASASASTTSQHPAQTLLLSRAHSPDTARRIFTDKIKNKPLLLQPTTTPASEKRALRRHVRLRRQEYQLRKRKPRPLSAKQKRASGSLALDKEEIRYGVYEGLHALWRDYMLEVLGFVKDGRRVGGVGGGGGGGGRSTVVITAQSHGSVLASADFHGAELQVVRCADVGRVGLRGIVVRDTKFTFVVVTPRDEVKTLPKKDTVFRYEIPLPAAGEVELDSDAAQGQGQGQAKLVFELLGNQFEFRPAERANRKFKWKPML